MKKPDHPFLLLFFLLSPPLFWAGNSIAGKLAIGLIAPFTLSFLRWVIAGCLLLILSWRAIHTYKHAILNDWPKLFILGTLGIGLFNTFLYWALTLTSAINSGVIQALSPVSIIVLGAWLGTEKTNKFQLFGLIPALIGVLWVISKGQWQLLIRLDFETGDLILLAAVGIWTIYSVLLKKWALQLPMSVSLSIQVWIGVVVTLPFVFWEMISTDQVILYTLDSLMILTYVGVAPSIIAMYCWIKAVELGGANLASIALPMIAVFTSVLAVLILNEHFHLYHLIGSILTVGGVLVATYPHFKNQ